MKSKQEVIQEAYGDMFNKLPDDVKRYALENNGFIPKETFISFLGHRAWGDSQGDRIRGYCHCRPGKLLNIETNNGWIRIESEEDLPKEDGDYFVVWKVGDDVQVSAVSYDVDQPEYWHGVTHYQAVIKPLPPIY